MSIIHSSFECLMMGDSVVRRRRGEWFKVRAVLRVLCEKYLSLFAADGVCGWRKARLVDTKWVRRSRENPKHVHLQHICVLCMLCMFYKVLRSFG